MVFLKVIPTSLLFIHGSAGHCNLEIGVCVCVCDEFYERKRVERAMENKSGGKEKRNKWGGGKDGGRCGLEYGFGFPSLRGEREAIDSEAESKADRVAAQGYTGTQCEHNLEANKVTV